MSATGAVAKGGTTPLTGVFRYAEEIRMLKLHRSTNADFKNDRIKIQTKKLPIFKEINNIVRNAQKQAELRLLRERPDIANVILTQQAVDQAMSEGNVPPPNLVRGTLSSASLEPCMFALELTSSLTIVPLTMLAEAT